MRVPPQHKDRAVKHARALRRDATPAEVKLWATLRNRGLNGLRAKRQVPCGPYILDFAIPSAQLVIEIDGDTHGTASAMTYDARRDRFLQTNEWHVLRFTNRDVLSNLAGVLEAILLAAQAKEPSPAGGRGLGEGGKAARTVHTGGGTLTPTLSREREREQEE